MSNATQLLSSPTLLRKPHGELTLRVRGGGRDGQVIRLNSTKCSIGAGDFCTVQLKAAGMSDMHCLILRGERGTIVRRWAADTRINGASFDDAPLSAGDVLSIGPLDLQVLPLPQANVDDAATDTLAQQQLSAADVHRAHHARQRRRRRLKLLLSSMRRDRASLGELRAELTRRDQLQAEAVASYEELDRRQAAIDHRQSELDAQTSGCNERMRVLGSLEQELVVREQSLVLELDELQLRDTTLRQSLEQDQADLRAEIEQTRESLATDQQQLGEERITHQQAVEAHASLTASVQSEQSNLEQQRQQLADQRDEFAQHERQLAEQRERLECDIADLESRQATWHDECKQWEAERDAQAARLSKQEQQLNEQSAQLAEQQQSLDEQRDASSQEHAEQLVAQQAELESEAAQLENRRQTLDEARAELEAAHAEGNQARAELEATRDSLESERYELEAARQLLTDDQLAWEQAKATAPVAPVPSPLEYDNLDQTETTTESLTEPVADEVSGLSTMHRLPEYEEPTPETTTEEASLEQHEESESDIFERLRDMSVLRRSDTESESTTHESPLHESYDAPSMGNMSGTAPLAVEAETVSEEESHPEQLNAENEAHDDSIADYMAGLLSRVRGEEPSLPAAPVAPTTEPAPADDETEPVAPKVPAWNPVSMSPRRARPEQGADIAKMRELANLTSKSALDASRHNRIKTEAVGKGLVSGIATITGIILIYLSPDVLSMGFLGGVAALVVGTNWAIRGSQLVRSIREEKQRLQRAEDLIQATAAEIAQSAPETTAPPEATEEL